MAMVLAAVLIAVSVGGAARADAPRPLVGGDYYGTGCSGPVDLLRETAIDPTLERQQMFAMHASGLDSLGLVINYSTDPLHHQDDHGGAVTVRPDGTLAEPYRSNLIRYLKDARDAGFADVTIRFQAHGPNSPQPWTSGGYVDQWDPATYVADWRFVQDVRGLTKQNGPPQSHFDLAAEAPTNDWARNQVGMRIDDFIANLYADYVNAFGSADVFFSAIGDDPLPLVHEIQDLQATGKPMPQWWGLDIEYTGAGAARDLAAADATLRSYGLDGSLALEETAYEDAAVSGAVEAFNATAVHKVVQVEEYPNWGTPECVPAPYTGNAYLKVLGI